MKTHQDIKQNSLILRVLPENCRAYAILARLDRPVGIWLLLLPCLWGIMLAGGSLKVVILFVIGAIVMRSAGCVMNDLWDRKLDGQVERTAGRPLACGDLSIWQALWFLSVLLVIGLLILLQFNGLTVFLGMLAVPLIAVYPLMKRVTWWPQAFLGLVFNMGVLMGFTAVAGSLDSRVYALYVSGILWTLAYDTIYAHQDVEDDAVVGVKSTALLFGEQSRVYVFGFYGASWLVTALALYPYGVIPLLPAAGYAIWLLARWDSNDPRSCLRAFQQSWIYGLLVLAALVLATV